MLAGKIVVDFTSSLHASQSAMSYNGRITRKVDAIHDSS